MTYERINFVNQSVERPRTYEMTHNSDGSVTLTDSFGLVDELGTPINADTMNHIEDGIVATAIRKYNKNETFALGDWVLGVVENKKNIYKSLQDNNVGNSLSDKNYWEVVELGGGGGHDLFDIVQKDHILSYKETEGYELLGNYVYKTAVAGSRYGYPDFYNKCLEEKEASTATDVTLGESTITIYINSNGHQFFDIADKEIIDTFYEATGTAWFYGVDTTNERILLPRNDYYFKNGGADEVGDHIGAGLPELELTNESDVVVQTDGTITAGTGSVQIAGNKIGSGGSTTGYANTSVVGFNLDKNTSMNTSTSTPSEIVSKNSIYGNSDTVQPPSVSVLAYMVVGNTSVESAVTDVIDVTTSENDTLPLFHNFYSKEDMTTTGCYVNASLGSWLSGNIYTTGYNTLIQKLGTGNVKSVLDSYTDYDFVVNADDMTFRLPLKNGQEIMFATGVKGNGITLGLTNNTNDFGLTVALPNSGASYRALFPSNSYGDEVGSVGAMPASSLTSEKQAIGITLDSEKSGIVLDTENIIIPDGWNLYYKVSNAVQNLEILDVANVTADLNTKIGKAECPRYVVEVSDKSLLPSWYTVYSDGWCEQGGYIIAETTSATIQLLKEYRNMDFTVLSGFGGATANDTGGVATTSELQARSSSSWSTSSFGISCVKGATLHWEAKGYIN